MWWKFWTWFRQDKSHENPAGLPARRSAVGAMVSGNEGQGSDDILLSISSLIDEHIVTERADRKAAGDTDKPQSDASSKMIPSKNAGLETWAGASPTDAQAPLQVSPAELAHDEIQQPVVAKKASETSARSNSVPSVTVKPGDLLLGLEAAARREPEPKRNTDAGRGDSMRTLVAQDGHWPSLDELSSSFNDLDEADDQSDGPSPYQTIVPNDD